MYIYINSRGDFSKFFSRSIFSIREERVGGKETNCKEVGRRGQDRSDILSRLAPAHGGITKLKFNYTAGRRTCAAERFPPRDFSPSLPLFLSRKTSGKIASPVRMIAGRRRRYGMTGTICRCRSFRFEEKRIRIRPRIANFLSSPFTIRKILERSRKRSRKRFFRNGKTNEKTGRTEGEET